MKGLAKVMRQFNVNLVHCYDIKLLWPLAFFLRSNPLVPLVFTQSGEIIRFYRNFYYRPLVSRIDQIVLLSNEMLENTWGHLGIAPRKIDFIGLGCREFSKELALKKRLPFRYTEERWYLGTSLNGLETNTESLEILFNMLNVLVDKKLEGKSFILVLALEKSWSDFKISDKIKHYVTDMGLESYVAFVGPCEIGHVHNYIDLWICSTEKEGMEDYNIGALLNGCPVVTSRSATSMELLSRFGKVAETFKMGDSRELREKCEKILVNLDTYRKNLKKSHIKLLEEFGEESYKNGLLSLYRKILGRRARLFRQKMKKRNPLTRR